MRLCSVLHLLAFSCNSAWLPMRQSLPHVRQRPPRGGLPHVCALEPSASDGIASGISNVNGIQQPSHSYVPEKASVRATELLDALDCWMREQTIDSVLPKSQAKALLRDLRDDRRFWAQQRRQFNVVWTSFEAALRVETRPLSEVLGSDTSRRLAEAVEEMDDDPALVRLNSCHTRCHVANAFWPRPLLAHMRLRNLRLLSARISHSPR